MTEDYKEKLLKYLTGKITEGTGDDSVMFQANGQNVNNLETYLQNNFNSYYVTDLIQSYTNEVFVLIGGYWATGSINKGFVILLDKSFNILKTFTQYESGIDIGKIYCMNVDKNGRFFMIETRLSDNKDRFVMMNNFTILQSDNDYHFDLRTSYDIPDISYTIINYNKVLKAPEEAKYLIVMSILYNDVEVPFCFEFVINVGSTNDWNQYLYDNSVVGTGIDITDAWASWDSNGLTFKIAGDMEGYAEVYNNSNSTMTYRAITQTYPVANFNPYRRSSIILNDTTAYYAVWGYSSTDTSKCYIYLFKINYDTNALDLLLTINSAIPDSMGLVGKLSLDFHKWQDNCLFLVSENVDGVNSTEDLSLIRIVGSQTYRHPLLTNLDLNDFRVLGINNQYNLFNIILQSENTAYSYAEIYNSSNYNGLPYEAPNCLIPDSSVLFDNANNVIFARNLYNKTVLGATTTSTVQIPNTMLNDVTIGESDLISATNVTLTEDGTDIEKNIYETVNINFANSVSMRNDNDPNNTILNPIGAVRINQSTSQTLDYANAQGTKVRVNYVDGTSEVMHLDAESQIIMMNEQVAKYSFSIYIKKIVTNIQIISFDESTVYQTITTLNLEVGKIYNIVQYVSIDTPVIFNDVLYNDENVLYNNEQVMYVN